MKLYVYDRGHNLVNDPERSLEVAQNINFETRAPGGYGTLTATVPRNIRNDWAVKGAHYIQLLDGLEELYYGRLNDPQKSLDGNNLTANGLWAVLNERRIIKWWIDNKPRVRMVVSSGRETSNDQLYVDGNPDDDGVLVRGGYGDVSKTAGDSYQLYYYLPYGTYIYSVSGTCTSRTGEGFYIRYYAIGGVLEATYTDNGIGTRNTATLSDVFATESQLLVLAIEIYRSDIYDENDNAKWYAGTVKSRYHTSHPSRGSETHTTDEMMIDCIFEGDLTDVISTDFNLMASTGYNPAGFATAGGDFATVADTIKQLARFGDSAYESYVPGVWGIQGTPDKKARLFLVKRDVNAFDWQCNLDDLTDFRMERDYSGIQNWCVVKYTDHKDQVQYLTPTYDSDLKDADSIRNYGRRDSPVLDIGRGTIDDAKRYGLRYLAYRAQPLLKGSFSIKGFIRDAAGAEQPAGRVRATQRVRINDFEGGTTFWLSGTRYNCDSTIVTMEPDLPADSLDIIAAQQQTDFF